MSGLEDAIPLGLERRQTHTRWERVITFLAALPRTAFVPHLSWAIVVASLTGLQSVNISAHGCFIDREGLLKKLRTHAERNRKTFLARERILLLEYRGRQIGKGWRLARKQLHR